MKSENKVLIVREGGWGAASEEDYDSFVRTLKRALLGAITESTDVVVEVVEDTQTAVASVDKHGRVSSTVLVFVSRSMIDKAREIKIQIS